MYRKYKKEIIEKDCLEGSGESSCHLTRKNSLILDQSGSDSDNQSTYMGDLFEFTETMKAADINFCDQCGEILNGIENLCCNNNSNKTRDDIEESSTSPDHETAEGEMINYDTEDPELHKKDTNEEAEENFVVDDILKEEWEKEQTELRKKCITKDCDEWSIHHITHDNEEQFPGKRPLQYIAGVDISFVKGDKVNACAALVVLNFPELQIVYKDLSMVELTAPYIAGFLAFRESSFLCEKLEKLRQDNPDIFPQVLMVDGNGILHPRRCGLAVHLGIEADIPSLGVAKNLYMVDGLKKDPKQIDELKKGGDTFPLVTDDGEILGMALRSHDNARNPVYVSAGHKLSLDTAVWITTLCCKKRVPEPTRMADIKSRMYLREHFLPKDERQMKGRTKKQISKNAKNNRSKAQTKPHSDDEQIPEQTT